MNIIHRVVKFYIDLYKLIKIKISTIFFNFT